ncbi:MAG: hypothetical protein R2824_14610 [Saprospiraceae bacterium]
MKQWSMRITAYADWLYGLDDIDWPESLKEQQRNWIGRSQGASVRFALEKDTDTKIEVFTTRVIPFMGSPSCVWLRSTNWSLSSPRPNSSRR